MKNELLPYYERELIFIRKIAAEFAEQYPERAAALKLTKDGCDDPHVERIIEAFALIAGRIQRKIDDEFPEVTNSLLELLYPHLVRPVPSMAILQFGVDPQLSKETAGQLVPRGTTAYSASMNGVQCRFRTAYPARLWPLEVSSACFGSAMDIAGGISGEDARYAIRIELTLLGDGKFSQLNMKDLRFRIGGEAQAAFWLYELIFNKTKRILIRPLDKSGRAERGDTSRSISLPATSIKPVGFAREESLLPASDTSFQGYRLLQEYFCFPQKFLFFDLADLDRNSMEGFGSRIEILILLNAIDQEDRVLMLESAVRADTFQLGCTPAINLFEHTADPIRLSQTKTEYEILPDANATAGLEVYSVDRVVSLTPTTVDTKEYRALYSLLHGRGETNKKGSESFWFSTRRPSAREGDRGSDVYLTMIDRNLKLSDPATESITLNLTCTNRDLPLDLRLNGTWGELDLENGAMIETRVAFGPTAPIRPSFQGGSQWRLVSHLSLNHLSLVDGGVDALREILRLYDPATTHSTSRQIDGLMSVRSGRKMARLDSEYGFVFCQGITIDAEMDEDKFSGGGAFLLASVLERFFGLYCAVNSFTQLRVSTRKREGVVWQWPIRSGEQAVA
jgi:type VI secretion system protein ImpG